MVSRRNILYGGASFPALALSTRALKADAYPSKPIKLVVPFAAGGSNDIIARPWAEKMRSSLGPIVVENIGGAGGAVGCAAVARAAAHGYTILLGNAGNQVVIPLASFHAPYDSAKDFRAIYRLVTNGLAVAVGPSLQINYLKELVAYAKPNPGKLSLAQPGRHHQSSRG
jgi:tripartite-type tricarboxylate transporter receptor subunit TctC